jgi:hypothetical protein
LGQTLNQAIKEQGLKPIEEINWGKTIKGEQPSEAIGPQQEVNKRDLPEWKVESSPARQQFRAEQADKDIRQISHISGDKFYQAVKNLTGDDLDAAKEVQKFNAHPGGKTEGVPDLETALKNAGKDTDGLVITSTKKFPTASKRWEMNVPTRQDVMDWFVDQNYGPREIVRLAKQAPTKSGASGLPTGTIKNPFMKFMREPFSKNPEAGVLKVGGEEAPSIQSATERREPETHDERIAWLKSQAKYPEFVARRPGESGRKYESRIEQEYESAKTKAPSPEAAKPIQRQSPESYGSRVSEHETLDEATDEAGRLSGAPSFAFRRGSSANGFSVRQLDTGRWGVFQK